MTQSSDAIVVVAQTDAGTGDGNGDSDQTRTGGGMSGMLILMPLILIAFLWMSSRSQKRRERERQAVLDAIKPKDRVITVGGVHGRVVEIKDDSIVLRVDSDKDVRITVTKNSISRRVGDEDGEGVVGNG